MQTIFCWSLYIICYTDIVVFPSLVARKSQKTPKGTCVEGLCTVGLDMHNCMLYIVRCVLVKPHRISVVSIYWLTVFVYSYIHLYMYIHIFVSQ